MKKNIIFSLSLLLPFVMMLLYVWLTASELPLRDNIYLIAGGPIEAFLKGSLTFSDLWRASDGQRFLGYNLFLLANVKWLSLNDKALALCIPVFILFAAVLLYCNYKKSFLPERSPEFIAASFFVLSFIIFNVIQWESLIFGYALAYQSSMPFFMMSFITLERFLDHGGRKNFVAASISMALAVLVFSGKLYIVLAPALLCTFICYVFTQHVRFTQDFRLRVLLIVLLLSVIIFIYSYQIQHNDYVSDQVFYAAEIFANPLQAAQFLLASFGVSIIGIDAFFAFSFLTLQTVVALGCFVVILYIAALLLFVNQKMYKKTYLPFFLIIQTLIYMVFMTFRRFGLGLDYGMASRFAYIHLLGLAAIIWIFIFALTRRKQLRLFKKLFLYGAGGVILSGLLMGSAVTWHVQPGRRAYFKQLNDIAMRVETATDEELMNIGVWPDQVRGALRLLREHDLSIYRKGRTDNK